MVISNYCLSLLSQSDNHFKNLSIMLYDFSIKTESGELYSVKHRFNHMMAFIGWDVYKNGNWIDFIQEDGQRDCKDDTEAIALGRESERLENEAERSFNEQHPELNP